MSSVKKSSRSALTLIELMIVVVILAVLAAIVLPRLNGAASQAGYAANSTTIADMNKAISTFEARYNKSPNGWDGIVTSAGDLYSKLHPNVLNTAANVKLPILVPTALTDLQVASLADAGIKALHFNHENATGESYLPSDTGLDWGALTTGKKVAMLQVQGTADGWTAHGSTFPDRAFNLNPFNVGPNSSLAGQRSFVVFGVGQPVSLRGATIQESPVVQTANPTKYYSRMMAVYMIPGPSSTTSFKAQFVGSFSPDGTSLNDNMNSFNAQDVSVSAN